MMATVNQRVIFSAGYKDWKESHTDGKYHNSFCDTLKVPLTNEWKQYKLELTSLSDGADLSDDICGLIWAAGARI